MKARRLTIDQVAEEVEKNKPEPPTQEPPPEAFSFDEQGDKATAESKGARIKSLAELIKHANIDLTVWEVERYVVNKWEVAMREPATTLFDREGKPVLSKSKDGAINSIWMRKSNKPLHEGLFQVKVWLRRKTPVETSLQSLIEKIEKNAPILPKLKKVRSRPAGKRSLEICVMDPHIGLLCRQPEGDSKWDLQLAASYILKSVEDLVERTRDYGPFDEVFMPFGNDFCHVDTVLHTTTAGTPQPEAIAWHHMYEVAEGVAIKLIDRVRKISNSTKVYQIPGNHSRIADYTLARILRAWFRHERDVSVDVSSSPYKFHRCGTNLIGYEHGHSVSPIRLAALMANERKADWAETEYREWHLGDQHRKGTMRTFEEQGVSIEYVPGITAGNEWHRIKAFNHQKRGAMAFVWDWKDGQIARVAFNIGQHA